MSRIMPRTIRNDGRQKLCRILRREQNEEYNENLACVRMGLDRSAAHTSQPDRNDSREFPSLRRCLFSLTCVNSHFQRLSMTGLCQSRC
ncbi:hypothetical protein MPTK1_4g14700 [Marchantia polymorpha subsp. ruderalis]|uniref:Uncharacterized protein n=2 Tax=Marchantia polymorpha TaxID=3197 RepID=A0AAF6B9Y1_MARPO|nr:hypothetical protein MARPO_0070s0011 [Marchantia polymorpha]BBN08815.1 hypothetical protein Mp_4g14700 [Marchantia polymorpha subsp. ruderalis]|eukprot:PTQ35537.1 hypothetical protein MARPO_0070s0011 [Marchantia polymorpha]